MTNKEAIEKLKKQKCYVDGEDKCQYVTEGFGDCSECEVNKAIEALENQETVVEKLEKMKEKIQKLAYYDGDYGFILPEMEVSDILYAYIHELKGE